MPIVTLSNVATAITKLVAVDALPALLGELLVANLVHRDFEPVVAQPGDSVSLPSHFAVPPSPIFLNTHAEATFKIPDVTKVLAVPELLGLYMQPAIMVLVDRIEADLMALCSQFVPVGEAGIGKPEVAVHAAEKALFDARVPASAPKYLITDFTTYSALMQIRRFSEFNSAGEAGLRALVNGRVGRIGDFYVLRSCHVRKTGDCPVATHNLAFARDAMVLATRRLAQPLPGTGALAEYAEIGNFGMRVVTTYDPSSLSQQFTLGVLYGAAVLRNSFGVQVMT